jgi:hypothetical protein
MPYRKVEESELVVGEDYVLTHVGCKPKTGNNGTTFVQGKKTLPYSGTTYNAVVEACERVETPPGSMGALERGYKTWLRINPPAVYDWGRRSSMSHVNHGVKPSDYVKRAFYAGRNAAGAHIFTQERSVGSKKAVDFVPVNVAATKADGYGRQVPVHGHGLSVGPGGHWVVWEDFGQQPGEAAAHAAAANRNAANGNNGANRNVPMGNLLNMNRPRMPNANNATRKGRENWYKQHNREQELKGLFGGGRRRRSTRRRRTY